MSEKPSSPRRSRLGFSGRSHGSIMVIGLGRFGSSLAHTLVEMGHPVLAVDSDALRVQDHMVPGIDARQGDCTNAKVLEQVGAREVSVAVVCIGTDVESSVLATAALVDLEVPKLWAKAITEAHGKILTRVGAHRVVYPESQMGKRTAHLVTGAMLEYIALDDDFLLVELPVSTSLNGVRLGSSDLRARHHVTVVCVKHGDEPFTYTTADTVLHEGDLVVIAGHRHHVERFADSC